MPRRINNLTLLILIILTSWLLLLTAILEAVAFSAVKTQSELNTGVKTLCTKHQVVLEYPSLETRSCTRSLETLHQKTHELFFRVTLAFVFLWSLAILILLIKFGYERD